MEWAIYLDGLYEFITRTHREYTKGLPIYVTENSMASPDVIEGAGVQDDVRIDFLNQHFAAAKRSVDNGVPLKGYYVWSLMDNYE